MNRPAHYLPYETVEEANAAGVHSGTLANGDTFGDEDDPESNDYRRDPRDAVCEAASDYLLGLREPEFAALNGGVDELRAILQSAHDKWAESLEST